MAHSAGLLRFAHSTQYESYKIHNFLRIESNSREFQNLWEIEVKSASKVIDISLTRQQWYILTLKQLLKP